MAAVTVDAIYEVCRSCGSRVRVVETWGKKVLVEPEPDGRGQIVITRDGMTGVPMRVEWIIGGLPDDVQEQRFRLHQAVAELGLSGVCPGGETVRTPLGSLRDGAEGIREEQRELARQRKLEADHQRERQSGWN
jgi:hypothetical protein